MATMRNKPVSFNMENEEDKQLFDFANQQKNFSGWVKWMMMEDMKRRKKPETIIQTASGGVKISKKDS